jgi:hypothetical protein
MKLIRRIAGDCRATAAATKPRVAARLYPGAVEATPITTLDTKPIAFFFKPLSSTPFPAAAFGELGVGTAALSTWATVCPAGTGRKWRMS